MLTATALKTLLASHHLRLSKRLGQHHLIDPVIVERVMGVCAVTGTDTVVEIGAGLGALTESLAQRAQQVMAVEIDRGIGAVLTAQMAERPNVTVHCEDILRFPWRGHSNVVVVGAIPYHITSPILVALSEAAASITRACLVLQDDVTDRLLAEPGTKAYGRLSVLGQYHWAMEKCFRIGRRAFFPQPTVESSCVRFTPHGTPPVAVEDEAAFFRLVAAAFSQRRKTLINCVLAADHWEISRDHLSTVLEALHLPTTVRGETLTLSQFAELSRTLERQNSLR